jgi:hypothetical protein
VIGGEAKYSFGTAVLLFCIFVVLFTCMSINILILSAAFGVIKLRIAMSLLRLMMGWPVVALNMFVGIFGLTLHILRKQRDLQAAREIVGMGERLLLANRGNAAAFTEAKAQGATTSITTVTAPSSGSNVLESLGSVGGIIQSALSKIGTPHHSSPGMLAPGQSVNVPGSKREQKMPPPK